MSTHHSDEEELARDGHELVQYGGSRTAGEGRSLVDSMTDTISKTHPEEMVSLGIFANVICGRIFLLQASKLTDELMVSSENGSDARHIVGIGTVSAYHTLVMASVLKKRLQTHHFYSKHCVDVLESKPKRRKRSNDPDLLYKCQIRKSVDDICDTAITLESTIATEKKLYHEVLMGALQYPSFLSSCLEQIKDHKSTLKEQVVNQELKKRIDRERDLIKFVGELSSRLMVVTPLKTPSMITSFLTTQDILNRVNGIVTSKDVAAVVKRNPRLS